MVETTKIREKLETSEKPSEQVIKFNIAFFAAIFFGTGWLNMFPAVIFGYLFFTYFPFSFDRLYLLLMIPLFLLLYGITLISSLLVAKIGVWIVHKRITPPVPGSYPLTMDNPHTRAFIIKGNIKSLGRWLFAVFHLDFLWAFWLRRMGIKIGKNVKLPEFLLDDDLIEVGDNTFFAKHICIAGHLMDQNTVTINPTIIGRNVIFCNYGGTVGSRIGDNSIFLSFSAVMKGYICKGNAIYQGVPCKKIKDNNLSPQEIEALKQEIRKIDNTDFIKLKNAPIKINEAKLFVMKFIIIIGGILLGLLIPVLYALFFRSMYNPANHLLNILILTLVPIIFLFSVGFFVVGITLFTKIFISYYDRKAEIPEGTYELDDPRAKWFKIKYFLRLFGLKFFHNTPFKIADTFALRFWGHVKINGDVKMDDSFADPQYIELNENTQVAMGVRLHTHDIIDGKLWIKKVIIGKNVIVGVYSHIKPGVEIADGSVIGTGAWMRKNRKCPRPALWIGKPAAELPLSLVSKAARLEGKYVD